MDAASCNAVRVGHTSRQTWVGSVRSIQMLSILKGAVPKVRRRKYIFLISPGGLYMSIMGSTASCAHESMYQSADRSCGYHHGCVPPLLQRIWARLPPVHIRAYTNQRTAFGYWLLHNLVEASFDLFRHLLLGDQLKPWEPHPLVSFTSCTNLNLLNLNLRISSRMCYPHSAGDLN